MRRVLAFIGILMIISLFQKSFGSIIDDGNNLDEIDAQFIVETGKEAKEIIDRAFLQTRSNMKEALRAIPISALDLMAFFRQPTGSTRTALRAAEKREEILNRVVKKLSALKLEHFNLTDTLSKPELDTLSTESGCASENLQIRCPLLDVYRDITGVCNNRRRPDLGASDRAFARWLPAQYEDGFSLPRGWINGRRYFGHPLPLVREVSNYVVRFLDDRGILDQERSQMFMAWGQWIDHDLDFSPESPLASPTKTKAECTATCSQEANCFPIMIPPNDPMGNRRGNCIALFRTGPACSTETMVREQMNGLTSYIDAGMVYGSKASLAESLKDKTNQLGLLAVNTQYQDGYRSFLPFAPDPNSPCASLNTTHNIPCFIAGDQRANEHLGLMSLHTLFLREHNRLATELRRINPTWSGEKLYQESRKILGATMQIITYRDYLPLVLGEGYKRELPEYSSYNRNEDPRVANVFSIGFRFGHTSVPPDVFRLNNAYLPLGVDYKIPFHKTFFATWRVVKEGGIDPLLRGLLANEAKLNKQDKMVTDELRERLFERPPAPGFDLPSFNLQRGRDHGLPSYNSWRRFCRLPAPSNLRELSVVLKNEVLARKLLDVYKTPENIDLWIGGIAEPFVKGGRVGPLLSCIIGRQFRKIRNGDRFWWENPGVFTHQQLVALRSISLSQVLCANTGIKRVPTDVFRGKGFVDCNRINKLNLSPWAERRP